MNKSCVVLFTKAAQPNRVKTRLIGALTAEQAANLHSAFVEDVVSSLRQGAFELTVAWGSEDGKVAGLPPVLDGLEVVPQHPGDLGQRLLHGLQTMAAKYEAVAAIGSDHPEIDPAEVEKAFERLASGADAGADAGVDVVIGPADDGGYYLIAVRRQVLVAELFADIPWSTSSVCSETQARCAELGLRCELLAPGHDVDVAADLDALVARLEPQQGNCPATRRVLNSWGRLPDADVLANDGSDAGVWDAGVSDAGDQA